MRKNVKFLREYEFMKTYSQNLVLVYIKGTFQFFKSCNVVSEA